MIDHDGPDDAGIIFLDIDGVLNNGEFLTAQNKAGLVVVNDAFDLSSQVDPAMVARLNSIVDRTGAIVVLSSSWRVMAGLGKTSMILRSKGFNHKLVGETPYMRGNYPRGTEIQAWLTANRMGASRFVVLDDDRDAGEGHPHRFVLVKDGLSDEDVNLAVKILKSSNQELDPSPGTSKPKSISKKHRQERLRR